MARLTWQTGAQGARAVPGALVRWREVKRGPWQYGYYRGVDEHRAMTFSKTASGPIVRWSYGLGLDAQVAVVVPASPVSSTEEDGR